MPFTTKKQHAVKNVVFVFEHLPLPENLLKQISESSQIKEAFSELPKIGLSHAITLNLGAVQDSTFMATQPQHINGVSFERIGPDGLPQWSISIQENATAIVCSDYTRWLEVWGKVSNYLRALVPFVFSKSTVINVVLQYLDEFHSVSGSEKFSVKEILAESKYVASSILDSSGSRHSHTGFYEDANGLNAKSLHNVNINIGNVSDQYNVQITCAHKAHLDIHLESISADDLNENGRVTEIFSSLHKKHKEIMGQVLTDNAKKKINFNVNYLGGN